MKKTIYLNKQYSIENLDEILELIKQNDYEIINYSQCEVDEYIKIILDNYNSKKCVLNYRPEGSYLFVIYSAFVSFVYYFVELILFTKIFFKSCDKPFQKKYFYNDVLANIYDMGISSIFVIAIFSMAFGINLCSQTIDQLSLMGMELYSMNILVVSLFKGMGMFISLIVLASKFASGLIAKVGFMKITEEWNALKLMQIDPEIFLLKSKIISFIILVPICSYFSIFFSILGGYIVAFFKLDASYKLFYNISELTVKLFFSPLIKGFILGACLGIIASYEAFNVECSSDDILIALSRGIVMSIVLCLIIDVILSVGIGL